MTEVSTQISPPSYRPTHPYIGLLAVALAATSFGLQPIIGRHFLNDVPSPATLNTIRCIGECTFGLLLYLIWERGPVLGLWRDYLAVAVLQTIFFSLHMGALLYAPVSVVTVCVFCYPLIVGVFTHIRNGSEQRSLLGWMVCAFVGIGLTVWPALTATTNVTSYVPLGVVMGLLAAVAIALYLVVMGRVKTESRFGLTAAIAFCSTFGNGLAGIATGTLVMPPVTSVLLALSLGLFGSIGTICLLWGLSRVPTNRAALILNLEIVVTVVASVLVLGEVVTIIQAIGVGVILVAVICGNK